MPPNNQVEVSFLVKEEVSKALQNIKSNLKNATNEINNSNKKVFDFGTVMSSALGFSTATMIANTADAFKQFVEDGVKSSILFQQQLIALEFQTNQTADALLNNLGNAVEGTVNQLSLAKSANRALVLGLRQDDLPGLFEAASARAKIMGISVTDAVDNIVTGIGRGSPLILDNLGIVFDTVKVYEDYAATVNKTADTLTKTDRIIALTQATIESSRVATIALNSAQYTLNTEVGRGKAAWDNLKLSVGDALTGQLGKVSLLFEDISTVSLQNDYRLKALGETVQGLASDYAVLQKEQTGLLQTQKDLLNDLENIGAQKTDVEINAERELNKLSLERLETQKKLNELAKNPRVNPVTSQRYGDESISQNADKISEYNQLENKLISINKLIDEQNLKQEEGALRRKVITDEAVKTGEDKGLLDKQGEALDVIQSKLQQRLDNQVEYNARIQELTTSILPAYEGYINRIAVQTEAIKQNTERAAMSYSTLEKTLGKISLIMNGQTISTR